MKPIVGSTIVYTVSATNARPETRNALTPARLCYSDVARRYYGAKLLASVTSPSGAKLYYGEIPTIHGDAGVYDAFQVDRSGSVQYLSSFAGEDARVRSAEWLRNVAKSADNRGARHYVRDNFVCVFGDAGTLFGYVTLPRYNDIPMLDTDALLYEAGRARSASETATSDAEYEAAQLAREAELNALSAEYEAFTEDGTAARVLALFGDAVDILPDGNGETDGFVLESHGEQFGEILQPSEFRTALKFVESVAPLLDAKRNAKRNARATDAEESNMLRDIREHFGANATFVYGEDEDGVTGYMTEAHGALYGPALTASDYAISLAMLPVFETAKAWVAKLDAPKRYTLDTLGIDAKRLALRNAWTHSEAVRSAVATSFADGVTRNASYGYALDSCENTSFSLESETERVVFALGLRFTASGDILE